jgi:amidase
MTPITAPASPVTTAIPNAPFTILDTVGAWVPHGKFVLQGASSGPLQGLTFAAKDVFDVAGHPTSAGNPVWMATHPIPTTSSPLVSQLLAAGATLAGKTLTDELAYSLHGDNVHYGTPINRAAPERVTGGSSSGSAAAVAARLVDFALGTDTGGSTRVPASYCRIWGLRTTHGLLSQEGLVPLHPSFDCPTWLAHDPRTFERVADVLLPASAYQATRLLRFDDAWAQADPEFLALLQHAQSTLERLLGSAAQPMHIAQSVAGVADGLEAWRQHYLTASAFEGWATHGGWIGTHTPHFSEAIAHRWKLASQVQPDAATASRAAIATIRNHVRHAVGTDGVVLIPSAASAAPRRDADAASVDAVRLRSMRITCIAGLSGLPQVSIPMADPSGVPLGVSLVGPAGTDRALIMLATALARAMNPPQQHPAQTY